MSVSSSRVIEDQSWQIFLPIFKGSLAWDDFTSRERIISNSRELILLLHAAKATLHSSGWVLGFQTASDSVFGYYREGSRSFFTGMGSVPFYQSCPWEVCLCWFAKKWLNIPAGVRGVASCLVQRRNYCGFCIKSKYHLYTTNPRAKNNFRSPTIFFFKNSKKWLFFGVAS